MATKQQIMASALNAVFITPAIDILETFDGKMDIFNRSNKVNVQNGDYEYLPLAKSFLLATLGTFGTFGTLGTLGTLKRYSLSNAFFRANQMHLLAYWHIGSQFLQQVKNTLWVRTLGPFTNHSLSNPFSSANSIDFIEVL
ncbi:MAG: hypothetical protein EZS28_026679 [Streblomastix strix]|uniref:Uncharacterized protein n=1 Tax=Streblomastix strix TaxID=222440 RepID=A0A5J4V5Y4_9EUKA|nr:MAG: hypothetical protein EZS28_026679 [Streblomastix strix]